MGQQELFYLVEERVRILARVEELKARVSELEQQLQDSRQEVRLPLHRCRQENALIQNTELVFKKCCFNSTGRAMFPLEGLFPLQEPFQKLMSLKHFLGEMFWLMFPEEEVHF